MKKCLLAVAIIAAFFIVNLSVAKEYEPVQGEAMAVIDAEDIGISPIQNIEEDEIKEDVLEEHEEDFEESEEAEPEEDSETEEPEEDEDYEEENEEVTESPAPPEGMVQGYEEGVYFEPNTENCEICGGTCYTCPNNEHVYAHCVSVDERGYIYEEWCTVCGHGTSEVISDEEFEALGVETCVEF